MDTRLINKIIIDKSGKAGTRIGRLGDYDGGEGGVGEEGQAAEEINVALSTDNKAGRIYLTSREDTMSEVLTLGGENAVIELKARGGDGAKGGQGGKGQRGYRGSSGRNATRCSEGTDGGNGGNGHRGGKGGMGGKGGDGATITVTLPAEDLDLLMLVKPDTSGGAGGPGGEGGPGGDGGSGGSGGSSYWWTESYSFVDHEGKTQTSTTWHSNSGGRNGCDGNPGPKGHEGATGERGQRGKYKIIVPNVGTYYERYNLVGLSYKPIRSIDGIYEPGEYLSMENLALQNPTPMPTPPGIEISFAETGRIKFNPEDKITLASVPESSTLVLNKPLKFQLQPETEIPVIDKTYTAEANLSLRAKLPRVNKEFDAIKAQVIPIVLRYPVEASIVAQTETISLHQELPFAIQIRNVSSQPIGRKTKTGRPLALKLQASYETDDAKKIAYLDKNSTTYLNLSEPLNLDLSLEPKKSAYFSGTLLFTDPNIQPYTKYYLNFQLSLGNVNDYSVIDCIQVRNFNIQLADEYHYDPLADFVLVTNCNTKKETVDGWKTLAKNFGSRLSVWNASLYAGLSYDQSRNDKGSFIKELQDKVIIILDDVFPLHGGKQKATNFLDQKEILAAARAANVATLIVGESFDIESAVTPPFRQNYLYKEISVKDKYSLCSQPTSDHFQKKVDELARALRYESPTENYFMELNFNPTITIPGGCCDKNEWELGRIRLYQSLDTKQARIAYRQKAADTVDRYDAFNMVKLLPFKKKIQYLTSCQLTKETLDILKDAILSDLMAELIIFARSTWMKDATKESLAASLTALNTLAQFDFSFMKNHSLRTLEISNVRETFIQLLLQYKYIASQLPSTMDTLWWPWYRRRTVLAEIAREKATHLLNEYFPNVSFKETENAIANEWKHMPKEEIFYRFSNAYLAGTAYSNTVEVKKQIQKNDVPTYYHKNSLFTEQLHFFKTKEDRKSNIDLHEKRCQFDLEPYKGQKTLLGRWN